MSKVNSTMTADACHEVIVVGAGAAGVGIGVALQDAGISDVLVIDRLEIGASFALWPREMTFLTPSFPSNSVGPLDLNAVTIRTSPAYSLGLEHPDGASFAIYLQAVADHHKLNVRLKTDVVAVEKQNEEFRLTTRDSTLRCRFLIWAAGEFQYPRRNPFPGADYCRHTSLIRSYRRLSGRDFLVIGGYESGIDAAIQLSAQARKVTVLGREATWDSESSDPSVALSVYTQQRLEAAIEDGNKIKLVDDADVVQVETHRGRYVASAAGGKTWSSPEQPILATGFLGSHRLIRQLYEPRDGGYPTLTENDESTTTSGLFFCGPLVRHDEQVFCFIYKFRMRFAVVAKEIATRLGLDAEDLEQYRDKGMYLDDLSCCEDQCEC